VYDRGVDDHGYDYDYAVDDDDDNDNNNNNNILAFMRVSIST
jgi:hypothetical protein